MDIFNGNALLYNAKQEIRRYFIQTVTCFLNYFQTWKYGQIVSLQYFLIYDNTYSYIFCEHVVTYILNILCFMYVFVPVKNHRCGIGV